MRTEPRLRRVLISAAIAALCASALGLLACGSSSNTFTAPSSLSKCAVGFDAPASTMPATGGTGAIGIKTERECQWSAQPEAAWLSITAGASGQGAGTVHFTAAANADPVERTGGIVVNDQRAQVTQAAGECHYELGASSGMFSQSGGSGRVEVRASSPLCTWSVKSEVDWITITSGADGKGTATVTFNVAATSGPPRTGMLKIAGLSFSVTEAEGCSYAISPSTFSTGSSGGAGVVNVSAASGCSWTATTNADWISIATASGSGDGSVAFTVAPTSGPARTGTLTIATQTFTVTQSPGCAYSIAPTAYAAGAAGGSSTIAVTAGAGCGWTASSSVNWISLANTSGSGSGTVGFTVAPTTGPSRTGTITVAGQIFTVTQSPGCSYDVSPLSVTVDPGGGTRTVSVTSAGGCAWTASTSDAWITITAGASGSGSGSVTLAIAATSGPARSGTATIAGHAVTIVQSQGCSFAIAPETQNVAASGGSGTVSVTAGAGCPWTATSNVPWITIASGASGSGSGSVTFNVAGTSGPARSGTLTIAGRTFTVNQGQGCTFSISANGASVPSGGGTGSFDVRAADGCGWSASSNANWLSVTAGATGTSNGTVRFSAAANPGPQRTGTITAGGQTFTVTQDGGCSYSIAPASQNVGSGGGPAAVSVTAPGGCGWTASSNATWISISSGSSGSGNGTVQLVVAANTDADRQGTVTIAGQTFTVVQAGGCAYSISPAGQAIPPAGGSGSFAVNTSGTCAWTAVPNAPWIAITSGASGAGAGTVQFTAAANSGSARSGTITAAGQTFTVTQNSGCSPIVAPDTLAASAAGGSQNVNVSTAPECAWTAASNVPWIAIPSGGSGAGNGTVQLDIQSNTGPGRSGTATIAGKTVTVNQDSGCSFAIAPTSQAVAVGGGPGSVTVTAGDGCAWTAVSGVPWITVTSGGAGSGAGTVQFTVDANATGAPRSGTIAIAGQTFTVNQAGAAEALRITLRDVVRSD